jgi:hypothetical protein
MLAGVARNYGVFSTLFKNLNSEAAQLHLIRGRGDFCTVRR